MAGSKSSWLILLSSSPEGVSAPSFIQGLTLAFKPGNTSVQLVTVTGKPPEFVDQDENARRWLNEFKNKPAANPVAISSVDPSRHNVLFIPEGPGAAHDLASCSELHAILRHFREHKKPVCAVGMGTCALFAGASDKEPWLFAGYSVTGSSVFDVVKRPDFGSLPVVPEDRIKELGGNYAYSEEEGAVHVVLDRHLVTGQNARSTMAAVQNLTLLDNSLGANKATPRR